MPVPVTKVVLEGRVSSASGISRPTSRSSRTLDRRTSIYVTVVEFVHERLQWSTKIEFLLSVLGFVVDLGNIWRFPYMCYRHGGGAFLIPYMIMFLAGGLPLFYLELALGQYHRSGCLSLWTKLCPMLKGIGIAICIINSYVAFFYNTVLSWAVFFLFSSFRSEVPWKTCGNPWNTLACTTPDDARNYAESLQLNGSNLTFRWISPAEEFYMNEVLQKGERNISNFYNFSNMGPIRWPLALCLLLVYIIVYFSMWKGPKSTGKAVWVTATLPYIVLTILLIRGVTLPGAIDGIHYYLKPNWTRLGERTVWIDAATQIFFSLGPGFGVLLALASYNDFNNNCFKDAVITSTINCATSFLSGFVIFSVLGYMSRMLKRDIENVAGEGGPGLIFVVYPQAIATMKWSPFWSIIFFIMLITLGLDSTFGGLESIITGICDEFPSTIGKKRELFVLGLVIYCYLGSLPTTTRGGFYLIEFLDHYGVSFTVLAVVLVESIAVCWVYGVKRFSLDVEEMLGFKPGIMWRVSWLVISPIFIFIVFIFAAIEVRPLVFQDYIPPPWVGVLGWTIRCSSVLCIPAYAVYRIIRAPGNTLIETTSTAVGGSLGPDHSVFSRSMHPRICRLQDHKSTYGDTFIEKLRDSIKPRVERGRRRKSSNANAVTDGEEKPITELNDNPPQDYQTIPDVIAPSSPFAAL